MDKNTREKLELDGKLWVDEISNMSSKDKKLLDEWYHSNKIDEVSKKLKDLISLSKNLCE